jgi:hypothetical protein
MNLYLIRRKSDGKFAQKSNSALSKWTDKISAARMFKKQAIGSTLSCSNYKKDWKKADEELEIIPIILEIKMEQPIKISEFSNTMMEKFKNK